MKRFIEEQRRLRTQGRSTVALLILVVITHAAARRLRAHHQVE
jgi:hypothetical protein